MRQAGGWANLSLVLACGPVAGGEAGPGGAETESSGVTGSSGLPDGDSATGRTATSTTAGPSDTGGETGTGTPPPSAIELALVASVQGPNGSSFGSAVAVRDAAPGALVAGAPSLAGAGDSLGGIFTISMPQDATLEADGAALLGGEGIDSGRTLTWGAPGTDMPLIVGGGASEIGGVGGAGSVPFSALIPGSSFPGSARMSGWLLRPDAGGASTFGAHLVSAGDVNGDGLDDVLVAPAFAPCEEGEAVVAEILFGGTTGNHVVGGGGSSGSGYSLRSTCSDRVPVLAAAPLGDLNSDGTDDILLSSPGDAEGNRLVVVYGSSDVRDVRVFADDSRAASVVVGEGESVESMSLGPSVTGNADLSIALGIPRYNREAGAVLVVDPHVLGDLADPGAEGTLDFADAHIMVLGEYLSDFPGDNGNLGVPVKVVSDLDGDGLAEVAIGSSLGGLREEVHVVLGDLSPAEIDLGSLAGGDRVLAVPSPDELEGFGASIDGGVDLTGDGQPDIVVGAPRAAGGAGTVYVYETRRL